MTTTQTRIISVVSAFMLMTVPFGASAASSKVSCAVTVTTNQGEETITKSGDVLVPKGQSFKLSWKGTNGTKATLNGKSVSVTGSGEYKISNTNEYEYVVSSGSRKAKCEVTAYAVEGDITNAGLTTTNSKPKLSGTVSGTKEVQVVIMKEGTSKSVFKSKTIKVKNGTWSVTSTKKLADGVYDVQLLGSKDADLNIITTEKLKVGNVASGSVSVVSIPLLAGGVAKSGTTIPVSYLQVRNTGKETVTVSGFWLKQNGSASVNSVVGLETVDGSGGSRGATVVTPGSTPFKDGSAFAPSSATIPAGQMKLFTIKAVMAGNLGQYAGSQLKLDVTGLGASGTATGAFPIMGTTWVLAQ